MDFNDDVILPFQIEATPMRGRLVRLGDSVDTIMRLHDYPFAVCSLLGQATAMAAALGTALKFDGIFTVQTQTDGPVRRLVVDVTSDGALRACASFDREAVLAKKEDLLGRGQLVFTVDQRLSDERYQGIVQIENDNLTQAFQLYFKQSEQIPTELMAAARQDQKGRWHAGCLMLQRMPNEGGHKGVSADEAAADEGWNKAMALMQTCTAEELTDPALGPDRLLYRLFHEDGVCVFAPKALRHECRCSQEKIMEVLSGLPANEIAGMTQENGLITVSCHFCSRDYRLDPKVISRPSGA